MNYIKKDSVPSAGRRFPFCCPLNGLLSRARLRIQSTDVLHPVWRVGCLTRHYKQGAHRTLFPPPLPAAPLTHVFTVLMFLPKPVTLVPACLGKTPKFLLHCGYSKFCFGELAGIDVPCLAPWSHGFAFGFGFSATTPEKYFGLSMRFCVGTDSVFTGTCKYGHLVTDCLLRISFCYSKLLHYVF